MTQPNPVGPRGKNYVLPFLALLAVEFGWIWRMSSSGDFEKGGGEVLALVIVPLLIIVNILFFTVLAGAYSWKKWRFKGTGLGILLLLLLVAGPVLWAILRAVFLNYPISRPTMQFLAPTAESLPKGFYRTLPPQINREGYQYWYDSGTSKIYFAQKSLDRASCQYGMSRNRASDKQFQFNGRPGTVVKEPSDQSGFNSQLYYDDATGCVQIFATAADPAKFDADYLISLLKTMRRGGDANLP